MTAPEPWVGGLPWYEPAFSRRMLAEHLDQRHRAASRPTPAIEAHVAFLHDEVLCGRPGRYLDLACGPGLYTERMAARGHRCVGIDFAPAAVAHARRVAARTGSECTYHLADLREAELGSGFHLVTFLFGDPDTLAPDAAAGLLHRSAAALVPDGALVLEVHTAEAVERMGTAPGGVEHLERGLFAASPHRLETRSWWDADGGIALTRFRVLRDDGGREEHVITTQAREAAGYAGWLADAGFGEPAAYHSFGVDPDPGFVVLVARRR